MWEIVVLGSQIKSVGRRKGEGQSVKLSLALLPPWNGGLIPLKKSDTFELSSSDYKEGREHKTQKALHCNMGPYTKVWAPQCKRIFHLRRCTVHGATCQEAVFKCEPVKIVHQQEETFSALLAHPQQRLRFVVLKAAIWWRETTHDPFFPDQTGGKKRPRLFLLPQIPMHQKNLSNKCFSTRAQQQCGVKFRNSAPQLSVSPNSLRSSSQIILLKCLGNRRGERGGEATTNNPNRRRKTAWPGFLAA